MSRHPNAKGSRSSRLWSRGFLLPFIGLAYCMFPLTASAAVPKGLSQTQNISYDTEMIRNVMELLNQCHHDSVLAICNTLIKNDPASPVGYFLASDTYQTVMRDYRVRTYQAVFDSLIEIAVQKASARLDQDSTAESHFVAGAVQGYYCLALFHAGSYVRAIKTAGNSVSLLRKAAQLDPNFVDPLFGIAIYEYTRSKLLFGLLGGKKQEAIAKLRKVEQSGRYVAANASYSLQSIYFENEQYDSALVINDQLFRRYPSSPSALYNRAMLLEKTHRPQEALAVWNTLTGVLQQRRPASNGFLAESYFHLACLQQQLKNDQSAKKLLIQAAQFAARRRSEDEIEGSYVKFKEIKSRINEALRTWGQGQSTLEPAPAN